MLVQILIGCVLVALILLPAWLASPKKSAAAGPEAPPSSDVLTAGH